MTVSLTEGALSAFASGEESGIRKYDEAIVAEPASAAELERHRAKLVEAIAEIIEAAWREVGRLLDLSKPDERSACFRHAGYGSKSGRQTPDLFHKEKGKRSSSARVL